MTHLCRSCRTRYRSLAVHVREWHGWPFTADKDNQYQGGRWMPWPVLLERLQWARPVDPAGRLWCALP